MATPPVPPPATSTARPSVASPVDPPPEARDDRDDELDDLLERLHQDLEIEQSPTVAADAALTDARDLERPKSDAVVIESLGGIEFDPTFPGFVPRFVALLIDTVVVQVALLPGLFMIVAGSGLVIFLGVLLLVAGFVAVTASYAQSVAKSGQWIGNRIMKTRVVDARTGANLDVSNAAARFVVRHLISPFLLLGFLPALFDPQRRTFHDRVATSVVTTRPRETWSAGGETP